MGWADRKRYIEIVSALSGTSSLHCGLSVATYGPQTLRPFLLGIIALARCCGLRIAGQQVSAVWVA